VKYVIIVPDGTGDYPQEELGGRTPLEVARTPNFDAVSKRGRIGLVQTIPEELPPGSDVANLSLLGFDPRKYYTGRAPLEAASMGITLGESEWAFRCNLVTVFEDKLADYSAGRIPSKESKVLIELLDERLGTDQVKFYPGLSYRHLAVFGDMDFSDLETVPPHDIMEQDFSKHFPKGTNAKMLIELMGKSNALLEEHEVNVVRRDLGENPANMIWLWGQGQAPREQLPTFEEVYKVKGAAVCAVDLVKTLARFLGWHAYDVPGANGDIDTNFEGKGRFAVEALDTYDLVFVHVEAPDEASHQGSLENKIAALENVDRFIAGPLLVALEKREDPYRIMILPDHYTPLSKRTHSREPVPFAICGDEFEFQSGLAFSEKNARVSSFFINEGHLLMAYFISGTYRSTTQAGG
jgi:2,3-bisphosphoglycerate-independent phosphoglycerate mutase